MNILITGGAGFIGSHLAKALLKDKHSVIALDDLSTGSLKNIVNLNGEKNFELIIGDVCDDILVEKLVKKSDMIFHLAAVVGVKHVMKNPVSTIRVNTLGTENVLHSSSAFNKKVLIASTSEVYGKAMHYSKSSNGLSEDNDSVFGNTSIRRWAYATSKALDEFMTLAYYHEKSLPAVIVRFFNTVGPGQLGDYGMVLPIFVKKALANDPIPIFGDGLQKRSFTHVSDAIKGIIALMNTKEAFGNVFNVGNENEITILDLAKRVIERSKSHSEVEYISYEKAYGNGFEDMRRRKPDLTKIRKLIGYEPKYSLDEIIDQVIEYQKSS